MLDGQYELVIYCLAVTPKESCLQVCNRNNHGLKPPECIYTFSSLNCSPSAGTGVRQMVNTVAVFSRRMVTDIRPICFLAYRASDEGHYCDGIARDEALCPLYRPRNNLGRAVSQLERRIAESCHAVRPYLSAAM